MDGHRRNSERHGEQRISSHRLRHPWASASMQGWEQSPLGADTKPWWFGVVVTLWSDRVEV